MMSQQPYCSTDQCARNTGTSNTCVSTVSSIFTHAAALAERKRVNELIETLASEPVGNRLETCSLPVPVQLVRRPVLEIEYVIAEIDGPLPTIAERQKRVILREAAGQ